MVSTENMTIGTSGDRHDLAALGEPLRSHGGLTEQEVPFIVNRVIDLPNAPVLRNFDAFFYATTAAALKRCPHEHQDTDFRAEGMRIGGEVVFTDDVVEVLYPYTNEVIGTVPAGTAEHAAKAFAIAANYTPTLTRYERSQILNRTAELIGEKREYLAKWLTLELGICHQHAIYETKRAQDVYQFAAAQSMNDDGEIFSCDLTHNGKARKIFTKREPVRAISAITPFNHPLNMVSHKIAPSIATNNCMVCKPTELTPLTAHCAGRHPLRGGPAARDVPDRHRHAWRHRRRDDHQRKHRHHHLHRRRARGQDDRRKGGL